MPNPVALLVPAAFVLFGAFVASQARQPYRRYRTVADVLATPAQSFPGRSRQTS
ncbi:hypothetical protein GRX66_18345, partial [Halobacterium sp. PCN9]|nr:hypothetical protein [Halobacterium bonnevillei]